MGDTFVPRLSPDRASVPFVCAKSEHLAGFVSFAGGVSVMEGIVSMCRSVPVDGRDGVAGAQFLRMAADAWAAAKTEEAGDRALGRVRFLRLLELGVVVALCDAVQDTPGSGASWAGVYWGLSSSRQSVYQRFAD